MTAMASPQVNSVTVFVSFIGFLTGFMTINITLIQGLLRKIFLLPDQVLGLIGSAGAMTDIGKESEGKVHGVFVAAGRGVGAAGLGSLAPAKKVAGEVGNNGQKTDQATNGNAKN